MAKVRRFVLPALLGLAVYYAVFGGDYSLLELRSVIQPGNDEDELSRDLGQGDIVGETSLLTEATQPATVYAIRDSELIAFSRDSLERLARERFGMIRDGEILYRMAEPNDSAADTIG